MDWTGTKILMEIWQQVQQWFSKLDDLKKDSCWLWGAIHHNPKQRKSTSGFAYSLVWLLEQYIVKWDLDWIQSRASAAVVYGQLPECFCRDGLPKRIAPRSSHRGTNIISPKRELNELVEKLDKDKIWMLCRIALWTQIVKQRINSEV